MISFRKELFIAFFYKAVDTYSYVIISFVVTMILSRILTPYDYGIVAIANVFLSLFLLVGTCGLNNAIVQNKELRENDFNNFFSLTFYAAIIFSIIFFSFSKFIADFYGKDQLVIVCRILSVVLFFNILNIVPNSILIKGKKFAFIAKRTFIVYLLTGTVSVILALNGGGIYSLLITPLFSSILIFVVNYYRYRFELKIHIEKESINKVFKFSLYDFLYGLINTMELQFDKLVIGKKYNTSVLAQYDKANLFTNLIVGNINAVLIQSVYSILNEKAIGLDWIESSFRKFVRIVASISLPLSVFVYISSKELILISFGNQWDTAIDLLKISSFFIPVILLQSLKDVYFRIMNKTSILMISSLYLFLLKVVVVIFVVYYTESLYYVMYSILCVNLLKLFYVYGLLYKLFDKPVIWAYKAMFYPLIFTLSLLILYNFVFLFLDVDNLWINIMIKLGIFLIFGGGFIMYMIRR